MRLRTRDLFQTIQSVGGLLPTDVLQRIADGDPTLDGLSPASYHLGPGERLNERITRSWNRALGAWGAFSAVRRTLADDDPGTRATRELWLHPLFDELGYGRLVQQRSIDLDERQYPVYTQWQHVPIHWVGCGVPLDRRTRGVKGAAGSSPHSLVQELLNRSPERLWAMVTNGLQLRVLRDNATLTRQAYVEFDLESMLDAEAYSDFALLWLLCHQSRVEGETPDGCWLEAWSRAAATEGTRALDELRFGVEEALQTLGTGFLRHPANDGLRSALQSGALEGTDLLRMLMRLVYRMLFLFVAEDRDVLLSPDASPIARGHYARFYSTARLRHLAQRRRGGRHHDAYEQLKFVMEALHEEGCPELALPALGSLLWAPESLGPLGSARLANEQFLEAVRQLAFVEGIGGFRPVDFRNLGSEELGSIYESLLDLHPAVDLVQRSFVAQPAPGNERQGTGAFYTPDALIALLLDTTLDPALDEAMEEDDPEAALLALRVCDPACGSGHFLIAAAHRIARRLAMVRTGDPEPAPQEHRAALRDVVAVCLYGVDINPTAAELCKVSLWLEAMVPGQPLSFLDGHIRVGNSLLGCTIAMVDQGIPDTAFKALGGDDKKTVTALRKQNSAERAGQLSLDGSLASVADRLLEVASKNEPIAASASLAEVRAQEQLTRELEESEERAHLLAAADAWLASFVSPRTSGGARWTTGRVRAMAATSDPAERAVAHRAVASCAPFHWEMEFPAVFASGGFDVVVGNPPWGRVKLQEKRFFATRAPDVAAARNKAARARLLRQLESEDPPLMEAYRAELRRFEALSLFFHQSGRFPLTGVGDVNTYALFAELGRWLLRPGGRAGLVLQLGIATDDTTKDFFADLVDSRSLAALYGFENEEKLFPAITNKVKFCVLATCAPGSGPEKFELSFANRRAETARDPDHRFTLSASDIASINPNTRTCPVFRSARDAEITLALHQRFPVLVADGPPESNPWDVRFQTMFHMSDDSYKFMAAEELDAAGWTRSGPFFVRGGERCVPLQEGKMVWLWNPRHGTYDRQTQAQANKGVLPPSTDGQLRNPRYTNAPRYWVDEAEAEAVYAGEGGWSLAWRDVGPSERTLVVCAVPRWAAGDKLPLMHLRGRSRDEGLCLLAYLSSFIADYSARARSATGSMKFFVLKHLPVPPPDDFAAECPWSPGQTLGAWVKARALELIYTWDALSSLARDAGYEGPPFPWDPIRRREVQAELDACCFHMAGLSREEAGHVLDSFRVLRAEEEKAFDEFLSRRLVLEAYDALSVARASAALGTGAAKGI